MRVFYVKFTNITIYSAQIVVEFKQNSDNSGGKDMKKVLCTLLCLTLSFSFLAVGCGSKTATDTKTDASTVQTEKSAEQTVKPAEQVTLRYWDTVNDADATSFMTKWKLGNIELFQKENPNIKIEFTNTPNGDQYLNKISTELAANNAPDYFMTWVAGRLEPFVKANRLLPLNDIIDSNADLKAVINPANLDTTTFDGKVYALPTELAGEFVYYNKALFKKFNLEAPKTWDELLNCVKVLKENKITPFALANKDPWIGTVIYMGIFNRLNGAEEYKKTAFDKQAVFNTDPYTKSAEYLAQLVKAGAFTNNFNSLDGAEGTTMFKQGKAAMDYNGSWAMPDYVTALGADLGVFNWVDMPDGKGTDDAWLMLPNGAYSIGADTKQKDASAKFMSFMFRQDRQKELAENGFIIAAKDIKFDESKLHPAAAFVAKSLSASKTPVLIWDVMLGNNIGKELNLATQAIFGGADIKKTLEKLNSAANAEWNQ